MIGPKKLGNIRQELRRALATTGDDPIRWLEERLSGPKGQGSTAGRGSEVLDSLRRLLEETAKGKRRTQHMPTKK
jgi:hypothetical protein